MTTLFPHFAIPRFSFCLRILVMNIFCFFFWSNKIFILPSAYSYQNSAFHWVLGRKMWTFSVEISQIEKIPRFHWSYPSPMWKEYDNLKLKWSTGVRSVATGKENIEDGYSHYYLWVCIFQFNTQLMRISVKAFPSNMYYRFLGRLSPLQTL